MTLPKGYPRPNKTEEASGEKEIRECSFRTTYRDHKTGDFPVFNCKEPPHDGGSRCIFHDENYLEARESCQKHRSIVIEEFTKKVNDEVKNRQPLLCIGYYLPSYVFSRLYKQFSIPLYFTQSTFIGGADFGGIEFHEDVVFDKVTFDGTAYFGAAPKFKKNASFYEAEFRGDSVFSQTEFEGRADFSYCKFHKNVEFLDAKLKGEINFNFTEFESVSFTETEFGEYRTRTSFQGARFYNDAEFSHSRFLSVTDFSYAQFRRAVSFRTFTFEGDTIFVYTLFADRTIFWGYINGICRFLSVSFGNKEAVEFDVEDLSTTSFMNTDITRIRFNDKARWSKSDPFKVRDEERLERSKRGVSLESILSVYRNLRENYEYRLRFDEAGRFFIKEMELKRKYRDISSVSDWEFKIILVRTLREHKGSIPEIIENDKLRRNFSLTGLYYHLSRYGESIARPIGIGAIILLISTIFWAMQSNPSLEPHIPLWGSSTNTVGVDTNSTSTFVGFEKILNGAHLQKAFERSFADFLPLISIGGDINVGIIDYIIKIVSGVLTFGLLTIALRRKFERKYTR